MKIAKIGEAFFLEHGDFRKEISQNECEDLIDCTSPEDWYEYLRAELFQTFTHNEKIIFQKEAGFSLGFEEFRKSICDLN